MDGPRRPKAWTLPPTRSAPAPYKFDSRVGTASLLTRFDNYWNKGAYA